MALIGFRSCHFVSFLYVFFSFRFFFFCFVSFLVVLFSFFFCISYFLRVFFSLLFSLFSFRFFLFVLPSFSAPEPKAHVHYCDQSLSVVRPSFVCRLSSLSFHIFDFSSETAERNSTKLDRMQDLNVLFQVCVFRSDRKNKMAVLASDWLRHFRLLF